MHAHVGLGGGGGGEEQSVLSVLLLCLPALSWQNSIGKQKFGMWVTVSLFFEAPTIQCLFCFDFEKIFSLRV